MTRPTHPTPRAAPAPAGRVTRLARAITEVFAPAVLAAAMPVILGVATVGSVLAGLGWALLAVVFSAAIPYGIIRLMMRRGAVHGDHHIGDRTQRKVPLLLSLVSVVLGLALLSVLGAPRPVVAMVVVMLAVLAVVTVANLYWKLSAHAAVAGASVAVLTVVFGSWLLLGAALVAAIGWSRVRLRDHTWPQVCAGALAGTVVGAAVYLAVQ